MEDLREDWIQKISQPLEDPSTNLLQVSGTSTLQTLLVNRLWIMEVAGGDGMVFRSHEEMEKQRTWNYGTRVL